MVIEASDTLGHQLPHILLTGPPGTGKSTLAQIIANHKNANIITHVGPKLKQPFEIENIIFNIKQGDILFIDEIHRMDIAVQETLYGAMQDFKIGDNIIVPFTLIGATTIMGKLTGPIIDRFDVKIRLRYYGIDDIEEIINRSADRMRIQIDKNAAKKLAETSRQTPRIANRLLRRVRDYVAVKQKNNREKGNIFIVDPDGNAEVRLFDISRSLRINSDDVLNTLKILGVDENGLDDLHREYLEVLANHYPAPVGLKTIALSLSESQSTVEDWVEHWLVHKGFINKTPGGRVLSRHALSVKKYGLEKIVRDNNDGGIPESKEKHRRGTISHGVLDMDDEELPHDMKFKKR